MRFHKTKQNSTRRIIIIFIIKYISNRWKNMIIYSYYNLQMTLVFKRT